MAVTLSYTTATVGNRPNSSGECYIQNILEDGTANLWDSASYANGTRAIVINEGVNLIVDPASVGWRTMTKGMASITINNGKLTIRNTSTSTGLRFLKSRSSTTVTSTYILPYGLGTVDIQGNWIELGTSDGTANQTFTHWCTDFLPAIEVETASGSGVYEWWYNIGHMPDIGLIDGAAGSGSTNGLLGFAGKRCLPSDAKLFEQQSMVASEWATTMTMGQMWKSTIRFYDGVNGAIPTNGCKLRVPNIVLADVTQAQHLVAAEYDNSCRIDTTNGGEVLIDKAIFPTALLYALQSSKIDIKNTVMGNLPYFSECYDVTVDNMYFTSNVLSFYGTNANVPIMISQSDLTARGWTFLQGARFKNLTTHRMGCDAASSGVNMYNQFISMTGCSDVEIDGFIGVRTNQQYIYSTVNMLAGIRMTSCKDITLKNLRIEGMGALSAITCTNITVDGLQWAQDARKYYRGVNTDPHGAKYRLPDGNVMSLGVPYWFKLRGHHDWLFGNASHEYADGPPLSLTRPLVTYSQAPNAPTCKATKMDRISVTPTGATLQLNISWQGQTSNFFNRYSIRRSTDPNFAWADGTDLGNFTGYGTYSTGDYIDTVDDNVTVYYYKIRRYEDAGLLRWIEYGTFAGIADDFNTNVNKQAKNYCPQSNDFSNASWVLYDGGAAKSVTAAAENGPGTWTNTAASRGADTITIAVNANESGLTYAVTGLVSGTSYKAVIWLRTLRATPAVTGKLRFGASSLDITYSMDWQRFEVTNADAATTRNLSFTVDAGVASAVQVQLRASHAIVTEATRPAAHVPTTTAASASVLPHHTWNLSGAAGCGARLGGTGASQLLEEVGGVDIDFASGPSGTMATTLHCGTTPAFSPSMDNMFGVIGGGISVYNWLANIDTSSVNLKNVTKLGHATISTTLIQAVGSPGSVTANGMVMDFDGGPGGNSYQGPILASGPVSVVMKDCDFGNALTMPNGGYGWLNSNNNGGSILLQNVRCNQSNFSFLPLPQKMLFKGVSGCGRKYMTLENQTAAAHTLNSTDSAWCVGPTYQTATNDSHFFEMYDNLASTPQTGFLDVLMTPSTLASKPYEITGTARFDGRGYLYFFNVGDAVTWTWPHKIIGVSGFQAISSHLAGSNLWYDANWIGNTSWKALTSPNGGSASDLSLIVNCEYNLSTDGATWGGWKRATATNLAGESVTAASGFYLKLRLTAQAGLVLQTAPTTIAVGTTVTGATSGASGVVSEFLKNGASAIVIFSSYTPGAGNTHFAASETLTNGGGATPRYAMFPRSQAMYVSQLRLYITVDSTAKYPIDTVPVSIAGIVSGSRLIIKRTSDDTVLVNTQVDTTSYQLFTEWIDMEVRIELRNGSGSPAYKPWYAIGTITSSGLSVTALQERDDV